MESCYLCGTEKKPGEKVYYWKDDIWCSKECIIESFLKYWWKYDVIERIVEEDEE